MVTRHRLNLSISPRDFERLSDLAALEGKTPSTYALDVLKVAMSKAKNVPHRPVRTPSKPFSAPPAPTAPTPVRSPYVAPVQPVLTRQQRRAIERAEKKGGK